LQIRIERLWAQERLLIQERQSSHTLDNTRQNILERAVMHQNQFTRTSVAGETTQLRLNELLQARHGHHAHARHAIMANNIRSLLLESNTAFTLLHDTGGSIEKLEKHAAIGLSSNALSSSHHVVGVLHETAKKKAAQPWWKGAVINNAWEELCQVNESPRNDPYN